MSLSCCVCCVQLSIQDNKLEANWRRKELTFDEPSHGSPKTSRDTKTLQLFKLLHLQSSFGLFVSLEFKFLFKKEEKEKRKVFALCLSANTKKKKKKKKFVSRILNLESWILDLEFQRFKTRV